MSKTTGRTHNPIRPPATKGEIDTSAAVADGKQPFPQVKYRSGEAIALQGFKPKVVPDKKKARRWPDDYPEERKNADRIDGYDRDDLGESPDY